MEEIAYAITAYTADSHHPPQELSDLFPKYMEDPKVLLLTPPDSPSPAGNIDLLAHRDLINLLSAYGFLLLPDHRVIVIQRPGFRKDGKMMYCLLGNDGEPVKNTLSVSLEEFMRRLNHGFPDVPLEADYQSLNCSDIGAYEYDLDIQGEHLQTIHKAFLASGKTPINAEEARIKVQAAMDQLDPPGTWIAETGIRASDGSTPYYRVHCSYKKTDKQMDALVLLDGTVLAPTKKVHPPGL
jgi:hypothetical protein